MDLLYRLVYGTACRSTHHKFAMDALKQLDPELREPWLRAFLRHHQDYLRGAKDPDDRFRDFTNHVLHVGDNYWGGAIPTAEKWYGIALESLRQRQWSDAIHACGVLSHYVTDPVMPFHTAQSDRETVIHRACEWSICKSYDAIHQITQLRVGMPDVPFTDDPDWLAQAIRFGAETGYRHYDDLIDHYDFRRGAKDPPAGLDPVCREVLAKLFGTSIRLWAGVLSRLLRESRVSPPIEDLTFPMLFAVLDAPKRMIVAKIADAQDRELVRAMYDEWERTGKVVDNLPLDDRMVQEAYEREVLQDDTGRWRPLPEGGKPHIAALARTAAATVRPSITPVMTERTGPRRSPVESPSPTAAATPSVPPGQVPRPHFADRPTSEPKPIGASIGAPTSTPSTLSSTSSVRSSSAAASLVSSLASRPEPNRVRPERTDGARNELAPRSPAARPETPRPGTSKPETPKSESPKSVPLRSSPIAPAPELPSRSEPVRPSSPVRDEPRREVAKGDASRSDTPRAEISRSEAPRSETSRAEAARTELPRNEPSKPSASAQRFHLEPSDDVEKGPSIGPKTAKRLAKVGIRTVADLLDGDPEELSSAIDARWVTDEMVRDWQDQARLVCRIPDLRGHDAQLLVGCDYRTPEAIAAARPAELLSEVLAFAGTSQGQSVLRSGKEPDRAEVEGWIAAARSARSLRSAA